MRKPYQQLFGHQEDFKVKYRFYSQEEGGRYTLPHQGIRSDFCYESADHEINWLFMIYPEFEDEQGNLIEEGEVLKEGVARMWILNAKNRAYHRSRIKIGTVGYFREGSRSTGICEVVEIIGLLQNPTE
ncbi:hypothetical protein WBJ53_19620 [Spirosoma sp. SC4-14]|uniref:hypothetical protein n=1 Tax=Spirosoma sp. SC4-14 TaxID=3128900 RepID=UPI0030CBA4E0